MTEVKNSTVDMMMKEGNVRERRQEEEDAARRRTTTRMKSTHKTWRMGETGG